MGTSMPDGSGTQWIDKRSPAALPAIQEFEQLYGLSVTVLQDHHWGVIVDDGAPVVVVNREGVFALALVAPNQDKAQHIAHEFGVYVAALDERDGKS